MQNPAMLNRSMSCGLRRIEYPLHEVSEGLNGTASVQCLTRAVVEQVGNRVECGLVMNGQASSLGSICRSSPFVSSRVSRYQGL